MTDMWAQYYTQLSPHRYAIDPPRPIQPVEKSGGDSCVYYDRRMKRYDIVLRVNSHLHMLGKHADNVVGVRIGTDYYAVVGGKVQPRQ